MADEAGSEIRDVHRAIWDVLTDGLPAVLTAHERLDGDAVGSVLALWHGLRDRGLPAHLFFQPPTPVMFHFLPGMERRQEDPAQLPGSYNLVVIDCGTFDRVGEAADRLTGRVRTVNIDHHDGNAFFGDINYVMPSASSCGEMIWGLLAAADVALSVPMADCLFTAIVTDTGQFSHQDTTPQALHVCAECVGAGARPHELVRKLFLSPSPAQVKLRHLALGTLRFYNGGRIFAEVPVSIQGVCASALFKEIPDCDYIKVSMRSREQVDVRQVACLFGGGGHRHAAGCEIHDTLANARAAVVRQLEQHLAGQLEE